MIIGKLIAVLGADTKGLKRGMAEGSKAVKTHSKRMRGQIDKTRKSVLNMNTAFMAMAAMFAGHRVVGSFIEVAAGFEKMQVKLDALTDGKGAETLERINDWAIKMPVNTRQAVDAFVTMQAMGLDPTIDKMQILADVSSIFGDEVLGRVSLALGQMSTLGRVSAQDLNQLAQAGINARRYLRDAFGMTVEEFQKSGKAVSDAVNAIWSGMEREFGGSALRMMDSWAGLVVTFKSGLVELQRAVMGAGVFEALKERLKEANVALFDFLENSRELIKIKVPEYVDAVETAFSKMWAILTYDPDIIKWGLAGLLIGGKKGMAVVGGMAHLVNVINLQAKAFQAMSDEQITFGQFATSNYRELKALLESIGVSTESSVITPMKKVRAEILQIKEQIKSIGESKAPGKEWMLEKLTHTLHVAQNRMYALGNVGDEMGKKMIGQATALYKLTNEFKRFQTATKELSKAKVQLLPLPDIKKMKAERLLILDSAVEMAKAEKEAIGYMGKARDALRSYVSGSQAGLVVSEGLRQKQLDDMEALKNTAEEASGHLIQLTERTAWSMQTAFSDFFFDVMQGEFKSLEDYATGIFNSISRAAADMMGQLMTQGLFGNIGVVGGGGGLLESAGKWIGSLFGGGKTSNPSTAATQFKFSGGGHLGEGVKGVGVQSGRSYEFDANETVIPDSNLNGGSNVQVIINNNTGAQVTQRKATGANGAEQLIVDVGANNIINGSNLSDAIETTYNLKRYGRG